MDYTEFADLDHRAVAGRLLADGWNVCGIGDWAYVWRSPDGRLVARVCAFEPGYGVFVELCRKLSGHPMLPRVDFDAELRGGGRVTVMEALMPASDEERATVTERWDAAESGDPVAAVRSEAERLNAAAAQSIPFWGGLDRNPGNVMRRADGGLVLVDLFFAEGRDIYRALTEDPERVAAAFPADERVFICEIAALARQSSPEELAALRAAAASIA
ncbi:hypothetical protein SAMN05216298_0954 [Glycomyces sambucus]|uniref:Phosphotransferase enzyme family protein n=1 Tax=Glycomyces sambucus TaxID=380244 RepID=A0A1G9DKQ1_9ACTN|nr:hypothetical protein [Glycomyces sambucus]SDK64429.1 hypothetical protein SAMN05216298_0954 [Glycomyces sambucus]